MTNFLMRRRYLVLLALAALALSACDGSKTVGTDPTIADPDEPVIGQSDFVSADGVNGQESQDNNRNDDLAEPEAGADEDGGDDRTAEEGDIYRVLDDGRILNLNAFRGLQIIDFSDVDNPRVEGRLQVTGYPVELYTVGDRAYVLMNNWRGYWRSQHDSRPETYEGGLLLVVDIADRANPQILGKARVPGYIRTSRLTRGGGDEAIYIVTSYYGERTNDNGDVEEGVFTYVKSFGINDRGNAVERSEINLGGYVGDIQATGSRLMVSRVDWNRNEPRSQISLIDISSPDGTMVEGAQVEVRGYVANKHNMNMHGDVLRIVSGSTWSGTRTNHVQTYDASDIHDLVEIDHATFGDGENLFATLFEGNKAFFVTYLRVDPFHAFEITDDGQIFERAEYIISGWNNFFRVIEDGDRLLGIGVNDEDGDRTLAVSLYNITDLSNPDPFIAREEVEASHAWSEANWDDRAFSIIENAVEIETEDGKLETGLVLLPFSGWDRETERYFAAVQVFTFSEDTLTQRGLMHHGTPVRRSFRADGDTTANLSEAELSLFDTSNPDEPRELGRLELAPNYTDILIYGDHGIRVRSQDYYYGWYGRNDVERPLDKLEVISLDENPDMAEAMATIEVPAGAGLHKVGDLLVITQMTPIADTDPVAYSTDITTYDMSRPTAPALQSELTTDQLKPSWNYGYYGRGFEDDCWDCWYGHARPQAHAVGDALVFTELVPEQLLLGNEEICHEYPTERNDRYGDCWDENGPQSCVYLTGNRTCRSLNGAEPHCTGSFYACTQNDEGETRCEEIDREGVPSESHCYDYDRYRYWQHHELHVLDLTNPAAPALADAITMPTEEEAAGILTEGDALYLSYKIPAEVEDDVRPFVRYYFKRVDLSNPAEPAVASGINVPGHLLAVHDGGNVVITQDTVWGNDIVEAAINRLTIRGDRAFLDARRRLSDQIVQNVAIDDDGNLLVSHRETWRRYENNQDQLQKLTIFDASLPNLPRLSETDVDIWAQLQDVQNGRALFSVPGGLLVFNLDDARNPAAQAYFPANGWPQGIRMEGDQIFFAAGRYGLYSFDIDEFNLNF